MYLSLLYCIKAVVCRLYEMLYPCICNFVISCWKSVAYGFFICRGGTDMCFVPGSGWKHLDLEQYRISGLTTFEVIGGIADLVAICNMACLELPFDAAKPVIGVKGLGGVTENRGMKPDEVVQRHQLVALLSGVASNDLHQMVRVSAVPLNLHQNLSHRGWGWKVAFLLFIPTTLGTTKLATGSLRYPGGGNQSQTELMERV